MSEVIANDGVRIHYEVWGSGATDVFLLHGMGGSIDMWLPVRPYLNESKLRFIAIDLRGHGQSRGSADGLTYPQVTADLLAVADAAGVETAVIAALSGSGKNAVWFAAENPARVRGLVLAAPPGLGVVPLPDEAISGMFDCLTQTGKAPPEFDAWFTEKIGSGREAVVQAMARTPRAVLDATADLWIRTSVETQAAKIRQPVWVIAGAREALYTPEFQRQATLAVLPLAKMVILDCAHFMSWEEPEALAKLVTEFCAELPPLPSDR